LPFGECGGDDGLLGVVPLQFDLPEYGSSVIVLEQIPTIELVEVRPQPLDRWR
jgi:hypothetical protein